MSNHPTPALSFSKRFLDPVSECAKLPAKLLEVAKEHVEEERDVYTKGRLQLRWRALERLLAIEERTSEDLEELEQAYLDDEAVNPFLQMICAQRNAEQHTQVISHSGTVDLTKDYIRYITIDSLSWTNDYNKLGWHKTISAAEYETLVWRVLGPKSIKSRDDFSLLDTIFLPWCNKKHWTLGLIHPSTKRYGLLNSLSTGENRKAAEKRADRFTRFVREFYLVAIFGSGYDAAKEGWTEIAKPESGEQSNGADCSVFVCMNAVAVARGKGPYMVTMKLLPRMREGIATALAHGRFEEGLLEL